jgi:hypothetical protein
MPAHSTGRESDQRAPFACGIAELNAGVTVFGVRKPPFRSDRCGVKPGQ